MGLEWSTIELENSKNSNEDSKKTNDDSKISNDDSKNTNDRANWGKGVEFLMSCISLSVGLGNVWRFPFIAYENGGGAFVIPYLCVLFFIGKPMYNLETMLGQFSSKSSIKKIDVVVVKL
uniref:Transporter n=1 Tax=Megaselia scalaris TaxID=36166 RepID=T1GRK9_MEGSC